MRKIVLFIFVAVFGVMTATAQEVDSLQSDNLSARVDSLSMELKQLRNDYDFFYCVSLMEGCLNELKEFYKDVRIQSLEVQIAAYQHTWDVDNYIFYRDGIDGYKERLSVIKNVVEVKQDIVSLMISRSNFKDSDKEYLQSLSGSVDQTYSVAESHIDLYKKVVEIYKLSR